MGRRPHASLASVALLALAALGVLTPGRTQARDWVTFAVFGDCQGDADGRASPVFRRLVQQMTARDIEFVLGAGDYIHGASSRAALQAQWTGFFAAMAPLQARHPVYFAPAPGNHDILGGDGQALFLEYFKRLYFSFNRGGSHFIVLDTEIPGQESRIAGEQRIWLKKDLVASRTAYHTFIVLHRPLYPVGLHRGDSLDMYPTERDGLHAIFVQNRVTAVFNGHEHFYRQEVRDGVAYITTGGGGAGLYAPPERGGYHHFLYVRADRLGYNAEVVREE
jgi:hypothetical protein